VASAPPLSALIALAVVALPLAACGVPLDVWEPAAPGEPLLVGTGPCSDVVGYDAGTGQIHGCMGVLLVEATRSGDVTPVTVEGRVLAAGSLVPLPGANVNVLGRHHGTATDSTGRFTLGGLDPRERLVVRYPGFLPDTLHVGRLPGPRVRWSPR
jgi:hypothetical protein